MGTAGFVSDCAGAELDKRDLRPARSWRQAGEAVSMQYTKLGYIVIHLNSCNCLIASANFWLCRHPLIGAELPLLRTKDLNRTTANTLNLALNF